MATTQKQRIWRVVDRLLFSEGLLQIQEGHGDEALVASGAMVIAGAAMGKVPDAFGSFGWLIRQAMTQSATRLVQRALAQTEPSDSVLAQLQHILEQEDQPHLARLLRQERAHYYWLRTHEQPGNENDDLEIFRERTPSGKLNGVPKLPSIHELLFLCTTRSLLDQRGDVLRFLTDCVNGSTQVAVSPWAWRGRMFPESALVEMAERNLNHSAYFVECTRCQLRTTIVALALERYRRQHGVWPSSLSELTPAYLKSVPTGPSTAPLIYSCDKDGVVVYTGPDLIDYGGKLAREQWSWSSFRHDWGVRLWDAPRTPRNPSAASDGKDPKSR